MPADYAALENLFESGRYQPDIAFLLSDESSWMTAQIIGIDGGLGNLKTS